MAIDHPTTSPDGQQPSPAIHYGLTAAEAARGLVILGEALRLHSTELTRLSPTQSANYDELRALDVPQLDAALEVTASWPEWFDSRLR